MQENPSRRNSCRPFNIHLTPGGEPFTAKPGETVLGAAQRAGRAPHAGVSRGLHLYRGVHTSADLYDT
jgi:hypothetical protein